MYEIVYFIIFEKKSIFLNLDFIKYIDFLKFNDIKINIIKITEDLKIIIKNMDIKINKNAKIIQTKVREYLYRPESSFYKKAKENFYKLSQKN